MQFEPVKRADIALGLRPVPVQFEEYEDDLAELEALLLHNAYRDRTTEQRVREAEAWKRLEHKNAEDRMKDPRQNFAEGQTGRSRDKIAERVGLGSGFNYQKAEAAVAAIDTLQEAGKPEEAAALKQVLNTQSVNAAIDAIKARDTDCGH